MSRGGRLLLIMLMSVALMAGATAAGLVDFSPGLLKYVKSKWGEDAVDRLQYWREKEIDRLSDHPREGGKLSPKPSLEELAYLNKFWNRVPYMSDQAHWGQEDYWATPVEAMASNGGDCEDYSIAKYFSLKELGINPENLRITYVYLTRTNEAHMVLAYYPTPDAEPYILDNYTGRVFAASEREDIEPVYSFNDDDMWSAGAGKKGGASQIRIWTELQARMAAERRM